MPSEPHIGQYQALWCRKGRCRTETLELIAEEPLLLRVDGNPYSVVMRTPGEEMAHAAGLCLGEGIVDSPEDFAAVGHCRDLDPNVIDIRLTPQRREKIPDILDRRGFVSQTSCGICGKEMVEDLHQQLPPAKAGIRIEIGRVFECVSKLFERQDYYLRTRGTHAAVIFDGRLEPISFAEDVGRHNALDKAIGKIFLNGALAGAQLLVLSSRISYELVQKAARARLPIIVSKSRPTALAVETARPLNMTLVCALGNSELVVVCGEDRIVQE